MRLIRDFIFLVLFFVLIVAFGLAWLALHATPSTVHVLLVIAVVMLILHFISGRRRTV
jgi:uncharacterized membrane protein (DUF485 family)